jgi:signal transduction histidine kinase
MRWRTWPVAAAGLAALLALVAFSVWTASQRAQAIYTQLDQLNTHHREIEAKFRRLRNDVHLSGIFIRDYLLDNERERVPEYRERLATLRENTRTTLTELRAIALAGSGDSGERVANLELRVNDYWEGFEPLFDWTLSEKVNRSASFLRREVLPRREAVLDMAQGIEELNNTNLSAQRAEVTHQHAAFRTELGNLLWRSVFFGLLLAVPVVIRLRILERRSEDHTADAEHAEHQMRVLSQQLVAAQEEERRKLSRELHDHVGQMLTALRMQLGRIDRLRDASDQRTVKTVAECRELVDEMVHIVRDLALGLRPSMLDDFGLQPALEWLARDFTRRCDVPVALSIAGSLDGLPEQHRTCVYRVVQEALTNCVRHAHAANISVDLRAQPDTLDVSVRDDGVGMDPDGRAGGLGLRGIEERVRELGGTVKLRSAAGQGAVLAIALPIRVMETPRARAAG